MKILFFIESLEVGGAEKSLVTLLNSATFKGYSVDLMLIEKGSFINEVPHTVNVIRIKNLKPPLLKRLQFFILNRINSRKLHSSQNFWRVYKNNFQKVNCKYDVAIAYSQGFATYFVAEKIEARAKFAWINTDYRKAGYNISFDLQCYQKFQNVIAVSEDVKEGLGKELESTGYNLAIKVIKDITDRKAVIKQSQKPLLVEFDRKAVNIVTVCRLVKEKGLFLAVEACSLLAKQNYEINWYVIGEGSERKALEKLIRERHLQGAFFLIGADTNPYPYMKACDIYVQTSLFEGLGLTVIEAALLNKPIVCTNFATASDILEHEITGLIAEMNAEDIASKIERLIQNENLKVFLTENLSKKENRDKEISLQQIEQLLD